MNRRVHALPTQLTELLAEGRAAAQERLAGPDWPFFSVVPESDDPKDVEAANSLTRHFQGMTRQERLDMIRRVTNEAGGQA